MQHPKQHGTKRQAEDETKRLLKQDAGKQDLTICQKVKQKLSLSASAKTQKNTPTGRAAKSSSPARLIKSPPPARAIKSPPAIRVTKPSTPRAVKPSSPAQASKSSSPVQASRPSSPATASRTPSSGQTSKPPSPAQSPTTTKVIRVHASHGSALSRKFGTYGNKGQGAVIAKGLRQSALSAQRDRVSTGRCEKSYAHSKPSWSKPVVEKAVHAAGIA